jgi:hypothetical protein
MVVLENANYQLVNLSGKDTFPHSSAQINRLLSIFKISGNPRGQLFWLITGFSGFLNL